MKTTKITKTKLFTGMALLSGLVMSQSALATTTSVSKECKQLQKQMVKSNYAKKAYKNKCVGKKTTLKITKFSINHKSKAQLEKERLEREAKLKAARAKAKNSIKSKQSHSKGGFFKNAPRSRFYIGASLGQSTLKPEVTGGGVSLTDTSDMGYKVNAGFQVKPRIAVEGFYADIGDAGIKTPTVANGKVNYKLYGLSGIYSQPFGSRLKGLVKLGYSKVDNTVSEGLIHKQVKNGNIFAGAGLAFNILPKLSIKGEYEYFDKDIQLISTGLNWQF